MRDLDDIRALVGQITAQDLKHVDSYVCKDVGIFVPSTGFCGYAVKTGHTHPAYSFVILFNKSDSVVDTDLCPDENHYAAAVLPPDVPHEEAAEDEFVRYIAIMASKHLIGAVCAGLGIAPPVGQNWHTFFVPKEIMPLISRFMEEYEDGAPGCGAVLDATGFLIVNDLLRHAFAAESGYLRPKSAAIRSAVEYIHQSFASPLSVRMLAQRAGLCVSAFSRRFFDETGVTPGAYLLRVRLKNAKKLLTGSEYSITQIAQQCAFSSAAHLSSSFKKRYGCTPSAYRSLYANL